MQLLENKKLPLCLPFVAYIILLSDGTVIDQGNFFVPIDVSVSIMTVL